MPRTVITTKSGTTIAIEGTAAEVAQITARIEAGEQAGAKASFAQRGTEKRPKPTLTGLISELIEEGFFREPMELGAVKEALAERGRFYPVTTLSPLMLRLVKRRELRRLKDDKKRWAYVR